MKKFKIGDKVKLKSGGPKMTIADKVENVNFTQAHYKCVWFNKKNKVHEYNFPIDSLEVY